MKSIVVTTFDPIKGPTTHFLVTDGFVGEQMKEEISSMINIKATKDYFIFRVGNMTSYNLQFTIKSGISRGNVEILMLSLVTDEFPTKRAEDYFLKESRHIIAYFHNEPFSELVFHLQNDFSDDEYTVVERIYEESIDRLQGMLNGYS
ncbi:MAG: hypothetical protein JW839_00815 [Candidatus Lokiarchaeota archaeon]|nr:hypothetical protein [Candidatus Lokiarchaeota archaeon]